MNNEPRTEEFKEHMRTVMTGKKCPQNQFINRDPEKIRKTAEKHRGMKRSEETCENISKALKGNYVGEDNTQFKGYWNTPFGRFVSLEQAAEISGYSAICIRARCLKNERVINNISISKDKKLMKDDFGKTWKDLGYFFEEVINKRYIE